MYILILLYLETESALVFLLVIVIKIVTDNNLYTNYGLHLAMP